MSRLATVGARVRRASGVLPDQAHPCQVAFVAQRAPQRSPDLRVIAPMHPPALDAPVRDSGAWLRCVACGWNGARDYAAAINIALLGVAFLKQSLQSSPAKQDDRPTMTKKGLNSESYRGSGLALRLPPTSPRGRLIESGKLFVNGWVKSVTLHSALPPDHMLRLCG